MIAEDVSPDGRCDRVLDIEREHCEEFAPLAMIEGFASHKVHLGSESRIEEGRGSDLK